MDDPRGTQAEGSSQASLSGPSSQNNDLDDSKGVKVAQEHKQKQKQFVKPSFSLLSLAAGPSTLSGNDQIASVSSHSGNSVEDWNASSSSSPVPVSSPVHTPPNKYTPHSDLWFQDGSVILATETTLFRVHISVLSRHSLFFRDMFRLPQPSPHSASSQPSFGADDLELEWEDLGMQCGESRCPVVQLHDSAEDLAYLLFALYDGP